VSSKRHPQAGVKRNRLTVRVGPMERTLTTFRDEIGQKVALSIVGYDGQSVRPLRKRLDWLETPLWKRAWIVTKRWWTERILPRIKKKAVPSTTVATPAV